MDSLPDQFVFVTANDSHYEVDQSTRRIRKLFRKLFLADGSKRLADGEWKQYDHIAQCVVDQPCVIYWEAGKTEVLMTSPIRAIMKVMPEAAK